MVIENTKIIFLNTLRLIFVSPNVSIVENVSCDGEKNAYSLVLGLNVL